MSDQVSSTSFQSHKRIRSENSGLMEPLQTSRQQQHQQRRDKDSDKISPVDRGHLTEDTFKIDYRKVSGRQVPPLTVSHKEIDLFKLFLNVMERGGCGSVSKQNSWIPVFLDVTGSETYSSNTGYYLKLNYERLLLDFERKQGPKYRIDANRTLPSSPADYAARNKRQVNEEIAASGNSNTSLPQSRKQSRQIRRLGSRMSDTDSDAAVDPLANGLFSGAGVSASKAKTKSASFSQEIDFSILDPDPEFEKTVEQLVNGDSEFGKDAPRGPPFDSDASREEWISYCEQRMLLMQKVYSQLKMQVWAIDRKLEGKRFMEAEAQDSKDDQSAVNNDQEDNESVSSNNSSSSSSSSSSASSSSTAQKSQQEGGNEPAAADDEEEDNSDKKTEEVEVEVNVKEEPLQQGTTTARGQRQQRRLSRSLTDEPAPPESLQTATSMYDLFVEGKKRTSSQLAREKMMGMAPQSKTDEDTRPASSVSRRRRR